MVRLNLFLISILCLGIKYSQAQNLVPNYNFEEFVECRDTSTLQFHALLDSTWYQFGSADYFNSCDTTNYFGVPQNVIGYQSALSGNGYVGLYAYYNTVFTREYIEIQLIDSLINGQAYYVRFYVSLADSMRYAVENIGIMFTDTLFDPFPAPTYNWVTGVPQVENSVGNMLNDKFSWVAISGSFIASGGEKYITIGNFKNDAQTIKQYLGGTNPSMRGAYYYIDDVYVGTTPPVSVEENKKEEAPLKLYPNPNNGTMTLECNLQEHESAELIIFSLTGKPVKSIPMFQGAKILSIEASDLKAGIYLYELRVNGKAGKKSKLTIIK
jgi:OOP family OmpA-OmpF porin